MGTQGLAQLPQLWAPGDGDRAACGALLWACGSKEPAVPRVWLCWAGVARNLPPLVRRVLAAASGKEASSAHLGTPAPVSLLCLLAGGQGLAFGRLLTPSTLLAPLLSQRGSYGLFCPLPGPGRPLQSLGCRRPGGRGHGGRGWVCHKPGHREVWEGGCVLTLLWSIAGEC